MNKLSERAIDKPGAVKAPATNLTIISTLVAAVAAAATAYKQTFETIFGTSASAGVRAAVLIAIIAAAAVIVAVDLLSRAHVAAAATRSARFVPLNGLAAEVKTHVPSGTDTVLVYQNGYTATAAVFGGDSDKVRFRLTKDGTTLVKDEDEIRLGSSD